MNLGDGAGGVCVQSRWFGNLLTICRGLSGPPGPETPRKSEKSQDKVWKRSGKSLEKVPKDFCRVHA